MAANVINSASQSTRRKSGGTMTGAAGAADLPSFGFRFLSLALVGFVFSMNLFIAKIGCRRKTCNRLETTAVCPIKSDAGQMVLGGLRMAGRINGGYLTAKVKGHHCFSAGVIAGVVQIQERQPDAGPGRDIATQSKSRCDRRRRDLAEELPFKPGCRPARPFAPAV